MRRPLWLLRAVLDIETMAAADPALDLDTLCARRLDEELPERRTPEFLSMLIAEFDLRPSKRPVGRPLTASSRRSHRVVALLTEEERAACVAAANGTSLSEWARGVLLGATPVLGDDL